jgi:hypothetical protein
MKYLLKKGVFGYAVMLKNGGKVGEIEEIRRLGDDF